MNMSCAGYLVSGVAAVYVMFSENVTFAEELHGIVDGLPRHMIAAVDLVVQAVHIEVGAKRDGFVKNGKAFGGLSHVPAFDVIFKSLSEIHSRLLVGGGFHNANIMPLPQITKGTGLNFRKLSRRIKVCALHYGF